MQHSFFVSTSLVAMALAAPSLAFAEAAVVNPVDEVVVTATRSPERADRVGQQITVLTAEDLRAQQTPVLTDVLSRTPGVSFSRNGGVGTSTQVYIRGAETGQTMVLIDGVRLNDPTTTDNSFNFGNLLTGDIARVEVLRGPQSVLWGSQAIGGVINLITARPQKALEVDVTAEGGSHGWGYGRVGVGGRSDRVDWRVTAAYLSTGGISAFDEAKGGREADGYRNAGASAKARITLTDQLSLDLRTVYSRGRTELDGFLSVPPFSFGDTPDYSTDEDLAGYAGLNLDLLGGRLHNRLAVTATHTARKNYDPSVEPTLVTFSGFGHTERYEYQGTYEISHAWTAVFGLEREDSHMRSASFGGPYAIRSARIDSVYAQARGDVLPGLTLSGGLRHDHHETFGDHTTGQASAAWRLNGGNTILRASWGQGFKAPSLYQLGSEYGNPALRPEISNGWDAGVEQRFLGGRALVSAAYFERRTRNQIDFVSCPGGVTAMCATHEFGYYDNIARTRARGVELGLQADLTEALSLDANYTWTDARNDVEGAPRFNKRLARRPAREANAQATYVWPMKLTTAVAMRYAGDRFDDAANRTRLKGYVLWDLRASYPLSEALEVYGRIENLFDERYETIRNYGQLGRTAYAGLRARF